MRFSGDYHFLIQTQVLHRDWVIFLKKLCEMMEDLDLYLVKCFGIAKIPLGYTPCKDPEIILEVEEDKRWGDQGRAFLNMTQMNWFSKIHNVVETATVGSEFTALKVVTALKDVTKADNGLWYKV
jgi:hypothetical protein